jgi:hypothetical protein
MENQAGKRIELMTARQKLVQIFHFQTSGFYVEYLTIGSGICLYLSTNFKKKTAIAKDRRSPGD